MQSQWNPLLWASEHWTQLVELFVICAGVIKFVKASNGFTNRFKGYGENIDSSALDLKLIMSNHLPHLQAELEQSNKHLVGIRDDFRALLPLLVVQSAAKDK